MTTSSMEALVVSISSPGPSAPSSQLSIESSLDAAAGVASLLCVVVTLSIALIFVDFFSLHKKGYVKNTVVRAIEPEKIDGD